MPFVADCSVTMAWLFRDEATEASDALRESLADDLMIVPALWPIEVGNVLLVATRKGRISRSEWPGIRKALEALPIEVDPETPERILAHTLPLAHKHGLSVYDATYLELALRLALPLATFDKQLRAASRAAKVELRA
ncbi:MAG: type II toxin-antitoxin system VapC family toxin [Thermoanaerobaculia bacterium]|nr:type II toxin-antitoxin system VapC family toxin [Thermoanaerobaculia bacterium]